MSVGKIGHYIHISRKGYEEHGITQDGNFESFDYSGYIQTIKNKQSTNFFTQSEKDVEKFQNALNLIFSSKKSENLDPRVSIIRNKIEQSLLERFGDKMGTIDWRSGNIYTKQNSSQIQNQISRKIQTEKNQQNIKLSTLMKRINTLERIQEKIIKTTDKQKLKIEIDNIYLILQQILKNYKKEIQGEFIDLKLKNLSDDTISALDKCLLSIQKDTPMGNDVISLIETINKTLSDYQTKSPINLQKGDLFEMVIAYAPTLVENVAEQHLNDVLKSLDQQVVGTTGRSGVEINLDFFSGDIGKNLSLNKYNLKVDTDNILISTLCSQEKIDVNMIWETDRVIPVSAKNVNLSSGYNVHILSGSSLLYLIQDENPDFVNHYLNIVAHHPDGAINHNKDVLAAHRTMKYALIFKAFTGKTYGRSGASVFMVNDNSQPGGVKIFDMADLIQRAENNLNLFEVTANKKDLEELENSIENIKSPYGIDARIAKFLQKVHEQKISVSFDPAFLNKT